MASTQSIAGVLVPDTPLVARTMEFARSRCEPYLFNHVVRSWLFAVRLGQLQGIGHDAEVLAVGTLLHDSAAVARRSRHGRALRGVKATVIAGGALEEREDPEPSLPAL